jgi:uridine kinase
MISLDHYYLNRDQIPLKDGEKDFESIYGLDIDRFQKDIKSLIKEGHAKIPSFDFVSGKRISETPLKMDQDTYILIEGIHALNPLLTDHLDPKLLFKIFISPHLQIRLDAHNPLRITVVRLLRRMVRDVAFRGTDVHTTLSMWPSVRDGEFTWIYPYLEEADYVFNSSLSYEMGVLKPLVEESLKTIDKKDPHYITANRLLKTIKYFIPIDIQEVPNDSILREFIGGLIL